MKPLIIGTRGSALARWQAEHIASELQRVEPGCRVELRIIKTKGDQIVDRPLAEVGGKGLFVKEIEEALLSGAVDLAVHSVKDLPAALPPGLTLAAIPRREDPRDAVVSRCGSVAELPPGASVGTSSLRRACQLRNLRPDLRIVGLRGNVDTRLRRLDEGRFTAIILAAAGLKRLGYQDRISQYLDEPWLCAVGQGALGIETRLDDVEVMSVVSRLNHPETRTCVLSERAMLAGLGGSCHVPIGGFATLSQGQVNLRGLVGHPDGKPLYRGVTQGSANQAEQLGRELAEELVGQGARTLLEELAPSPPGELDSL